MSRARSGADGRRCRPSLNFTLDGLLFSKINYTDQSTFGSWTPLMTSITRFIHRALGLAAAQRGRELSRSSAQHDGERFRNVKARPAEGIGKTLSIAWNVLFRKPDGTVPAG